MTNTTEPIVRIAELDERAIAAKTNREEMERLIEDFYPFLQSRAAKYSIKTDHYLREELFSTAQTAFYEAIKIYDADKGHFFPFAGKIVRNKLIDYVRKLYRRGIQTVSLEADDAEDGDTVKSVALEKASIKAYSNERYRNSLVEEIEHFKKELAAWKITMDVLVRQSPKHQRLKDTYKKLVEQIMTHPEIMQTILLKRYFPIKSISLISGLPHKTLERARTFILASLIIKMGDYDYLSEYVDGGR